MIKKKFAVLMLSFHALIPLSAQQFENGGLEGVSIYGKFECKGWTNVEYKDPVCVASGASWATPDIFDRNGPSTSYGMAGIPHGGKTFASGNHAFISGDMFQEGIKQEVEGFQPGRTYTITFYQAVVKQDNLQDTSGCWAVYFDNTLIGITDHTIDAALPSDIHKKWEMRQVSFVATKKSHWIKFMPMDDDNDNNSDHGTNGGVRMGIDDISLRAGAAIEVSVTEGPIAKILLISNKQLDTLNITVKDQNGNVIRSEGPVVVASSVLDLTTLTSGTYDIEFTSNRGSYVRELVID